MANASIGSYVFDIDPSSATWTYSLKTKAYQTYGGRVIQILRCNIENMTIGGYLSQLKGSSSGGIRTVEGRGVSGGSNVGGFDYRYMQMKGFERDIRSIMESQAQSKEPWTFRYPILGWEGKVFLSGYDSVRYDVETSVVSYKLSFEVDSGFDSIIRAASSQGLESVQDGVNWTRNEYNTPSTAWSTVKTALQSALKDAGSSAQIGSIYEYIDKIGSTSSSSSGTNATGTTSTDVTGDGKTNGADLGATVNKNSNTQTFLGSLYQSTTSKSGTAAFKSVVGGVY
jgi:hypothetical protein